MIHARSDYDRIQDPAVNDPSLLSPGSSPIGEDEPVFLVRAKDLCAPEVVRSWAELFKAHSGDNATYTAVREWARVMERWQAQHGAKMPDTPSNCLK